ncbi:MAG: 5'-nucleotidase [Bacteroidota bacterium]|nr:5'-nucleotidase [Bacteroidota bacterium]
MRRISISFFVILFLFSCTHHLTVREVNTKNISVDAQVGPLDSLLESMVKPYRDSIKNDMSSLVAVSATPFIKGKPESKLTNLVSDILLNFGSKYCKDQNTGFKPDVAFVNYGGLRASLPQGQITVEQIFELMPFENEIVLIKISGESFELMADQIAASGGEGVAGMKLGIKNGKVSNLTVGGKKTDRTATYWLVTNDYIADGGDQMDMFSNPVERINTKMKIRDVIIQSMNELYKKNGIISVIEDGRIYNEQ